MRANVIVSCLFALVATTVFVGCKDKPVLVSKEQLTGGGIAPPTRWESTIVIVGNCTAAVVSDHHILTASHCVTSAGESYSTANIDPAFQPGQNISFTNARSAGSAVPQNNTIARTYVSPLWTQTCGSGCTFGLGAWGDMAVIEVTQPIVGIPQAKIDPVPVLVGEPVTIMGYGCEQGLEGVQPMEQQRRLKYEQTTTVDNPVNSYYGDLLSHPNLIATPGQATDGHEASLCFGDSGGPVYRGWSNELIVGVNAYYRFDEAIDPGVSTMNLHTSTASHTPWLALILPPTSFRTGFEAYLPIEDDDAPVAGLCDDTCQHANDGECDDGGPDSAYAVCDLGTDCGDCGSRMSSEPEPADPDSEVVATQLRRFRLTAPASTSTCENTCQYANDGECDDGGPGSAYSVCELGSDCGDCGERVEQSSSDAVSCTEECAYANDGECDDGGAGSVTALCPSGTDCADCGAR